MHLHILFFLPYIFGGGSCFIPFRSTRTILCISVCFGPCNSYLQVEMHTNSAWEEKLHLRAMMYLSH